MGKDLKNARIKSGLTQAELAGAVGISERAVQNYEYGKRVPDAYVVQKLAIALNTTVEELFPLSEERS